MNTDLIGRRFGMLTVVSEEEPVPDARGHRMRMLYCRCDCGGEKLARYSNLMAGNTRSCGCTRFPLKPPVDLTGKKIRMLTVISEAEPSIKKDGGKLRRWNCVCECGNKVTVLQTNLVSPKGSKSCGCIVGKCQGRTINPPNLVGNRYGKLTVLSRADPIFRSNRTNRKAWLCRCDCGREVVSAEDNLVSGHTRSCGCGKGHSVKGQKLGMLTILSRSPSNTSMRYWNCRCDCGNTIVVSQADIDWGAVTSCGCIYKGKQRPDITGQTFGKLTVLQEVAPLVSSSGKSERAWLCRCECGREVVFRQHNLTKKVTRSCGCLRSAKQWQRVMKEGQSHER